MGDPIAIQCGRGAVLETVDGRQLVDLISSWWVTLHGHAHPKIVDAIQRQAGELEHVIFAGFTHQPAEQFAAELLKEMESPILTSSFPTMEVRLSKSPSR